MKADRMEDFRGQLCPMPIINLARAMKQMKAGEVVEMWADDEGARADVPAWCQKIGNEYLGEEPGPGYTRYFIKKAN